MVEGIGIRSSNYRWNCYNKRSSSSSKIVAILVISFTIPALALPILVTYSMKNAYAMGDNPSICSNRYDATVISMKIKTANNQIIDVMAVQDTPDITLLNEKPLHGYDVTFTLHTAKQSSQGNNLPGSTWYRTTAYGYALGVCVNNIGPDHDVTITLHDVYMGQANPQGITRQAVEWGSLPDTQQIKYQVTWQN